MSQKSPAIAVSVPLVASTYGAAVDVSAFNSFTLFITGAFTGTWQPQVNFDEGIQTGLRYNVGFGGGFTAPAALTHCPQLSLLGGGNPRQLILYCSAYTSGTPTVYLVGQY